MEETVMVNLMDDEFDDHLLNVSSSSDDDDDLNIACALIDKHCVKDVRTAIKNYELIVEQYTDKEFITHFRIDRTKVCDLTHQFTESEQYLNLIKNSNSRSSITPNKHILVFLWFAGHQTASFRDVADRFDLCLSSLHDVITRVSLFLSEMAKSTICLPNNNQKQKTINHYRRKANFRNVVGCIDGCHIKIDTPGERAIDYYNRKSFYSIVLQGTCNEELNFIDIFIGFLGSTHDARVFHNSTLCKNLENICGNGNYLLGDSAYPLLPQLITPYRDNGHLNASQKVFNTALSSCRVSIEHTFGLLKQRFRQLYHLKLRGHERICHFIRACCVLHNIANKKDISIFHLEQTINDNQPETITFLRNTTAHSGKHVRDKICRQINL